MNPSQTQGSGSASSDEFSVSKAANLLLESLREMFEGFVQHVPNLLIAGVALALTWAASSLLQKVYWRFVRNRRLRRSLKDLFAKLLSIAIWVVGMLAASVVVFPSIKPESILAGLGLSSIAIGFAFKDVVENFFAGFLILIRDPLEIGDFIKCEDVEGKVEQISIRDTLLRQTDGQQVVIPNGMLFKNPVWIRTDREVRRVTVICGVAYDEDVDQARDVIRGAVEGLPSVDAKQEVQVFACEFNSSSVDFEVAWWTGSEPLDIRKSRDEVIAAVKSALDEAGIEIPFPYRTLTFKEPIAFRSPSKEESPSSDDAQERELAAS